MAGWRERTPAGFRFAAKFPSAITHEKQLVDCTEDAFFFLETMTQLDQKLGHLLIQMPPSFGAAQMPALACFLDGLPTGFRYALEVRHNSWVKPEAKGALLALLQRYGVALCLVQYTWMPRLDEVTAPFVYIRWMGRRPDIPDDDYSHMQIHRDTQLTTWACQVRSYLERNLILYGFFNNHYQGHSPASVRSLQSRLITDQG